MSNSWENVTDTRRIIAAAPTEPEAEAWLRRFLSGIAETCPMGLLLQIGTVTADFRAEELRKISEGN